MIAGLPLLAATDEAIAGELAGWTKYPQLKKYAAAFDYLKKTDFRGKEPGRVDLDGNRMYATLTANKAKLPETAKFEAHRKYMDVHYLVEGAETIGSAPAASLQSIEPYNEKTEIEFFRTPSSYRKINMRPGQFAVFMPGQAHMPGCGPDTSATIRKVVVKILV
jgi:YhcH/YjgK/YiaL family protein